MKCSFDLVHQGREHYYTMTEYPGTVEKKVKLLNYFKNYMKEHLLKAGANMEVNQVVLRRHFYASLVFAFIRNECLERCCFDSHVLLNQLIAVGSVWC